MAIKQAKYNITLAKGEDVYHFETGDQMVKITDSTGAVIGSFKEFGVEGKVVNSGSYRNLKVTGIYKVTNLTDLPPGYDVGKISILSVKAVGKVGSPDLISYDLMSQSGDVYHNVTIGGVYGTWTSGGTSLKNTITSITNSIGTLSSLKTSAKGSLVNAINEVSDVANASKIKGDATANELTSFKEHNHDARYLFKSGDTVNGDLVFANNKGMSGNSTSGTAINLIKIGSDNKVSISTTNMPVNILSNGVLTTNGKKIWHEDNDGDGSGLDADKLGGFDSSTYARLDKQNSFKQDVYINSDKSLNMYSSMTGNSPVYWRDDGKFRGEVYFDANRNFIIKSGGNVKIRANSNELIEGWGSLTLSATRSGYSSIRLKRWDQSKGSGLEIDKSSENIVLKDWDKDATGFTFEKGSSEISFPRQIKISGRKLYMQGSTPTGARTVGDIWFA